MHINVLGIDIAKNVFHFHGVDVRGKKLLSKKVSRSKVLSFVTGLDCQCVALEACGGAHYWGREFEKLGLEVRMISPQFVKPFVKSNKNDAADAEAICEAAQRPNMRFVSVKSSEQQDILCLHRIRERLMKSRTALCNEIRGLLLEYGITIPKGSAYVRKFIPVILEREVLSVEGQESFYELYEELCGLDQRILGYERRLKRFFNGSEVCKKLTKIKGIGYLTATVIVASYGLADRFKNGRAFSASLGIVPRQDSTGGKTRLRGISKRGDKYIRKLLIHGARAAVRTAHLRDDRVSRWALGLRERKGVNKTAVALANKNARAIWCLLVDPDAQYNANYLPVAA